MRRTATSFCRIFIAVGMLLSLSHFASANKLDLSLAGFIDCTPDGSNCTANVSDYELFMAEYAFGIAPKQLAPAETLGYSGFYMGLEGTLTPRPSDGKDRWTRGTTPVNEYPDVMFMPAVRIRKGLPWSFEIGGSLNYLAQSELVGLGGEVKWSLFEGYRHDFRGILPDIAARGSVVRVLGEGDVDLTIVGVDGSISYAFGIGGMIDLTPYAGFQYLWSIVRTEPLIYKDENSTLHPPDGNLWNTNLLSGPNLGRAKVFGGFRLCYEMLALTVEMGWGLKKQWDTEIEDNPESVEVGHQLQFSAGVGMDF